MKLSPSAAAEPGVWAPAADRSSVDTPAIDSDFERFYRATFPRIYSYIRCQVGDTETAKDLVSRIFLKAYQNRRNAPSGDKMASWVFCIARNALIDYWRAEGYRKVLSLSADELAHLPGRFTNPEMECVTKERQMILLRVMNELHDRDRTVLALKFFGQQTNREIADILRLSERAVSMRLLRALRRMRERLKESAL